ncbi:hypothetical protein [Teredinibacter turnerae]|uniref:hypothetical protein n=1 Tax=Teredinibacter turnerae TaxID=2426 RepID=UPI00036C1FF6|nr:hypothetical protein [Teredinibacter turnerae]
MNITDFKKWIETSPDIDSALLLNNFTMFSKNLEIGGFISEELRACFYDYRYVPRLTNSTALNVLDSYLYTIDLRVFDSSTYESTVTTHPSDAIWYFYDPSEVNIYKLTDYENSIYSDSARLRESEVRSVRGGDVITVDSGKNIISVKSEKPVKVLALSCKTISAHMWRFDVRTGFPIGYFNGFTTLTLLELIAKSLGCYGSEKNIDSLSLLLDSKSDTVKYEAASAILNLNINEGVKAFLGLSKSKNPNIAIPAKKTIAKLNMDIDHAINI